MPKNAKKLICIFCPFVRAEMTSRHKNSSKTLQNTPKMVPNPINGHNIYIGSPSKKKNSKILTQGKSCFFTVNATMSKKYIDLLNNNNNNNNNNKVYFHSDRCTHSQTRLNILFTGNKQMQSLYCGSLVNGIGFQITEWLGIDTGI